MLTISATDLARNTREILDAVISRGKTVTVERNQSIVAQIIPAKKSMTATQALEGLKLPFLTVKQGEDWLTDSKEDFDQSVRDPWA